MNYLKQQQYITHNSQVQRALNLHLHLSFINQKRNRLSPTVETTDRTISLPPNKPDVATNRYFVKSQPKRLSFRKNNPSDTPLNGQAETTHKQTQTTRQQNILRNIVEQKDYLDTLFENQRLITFHRRQTQRVLKAFREGVVNETVSVETKRFEKRRSSSAHYLKITDAAISTGHIKNIHHDSDRWINKKSAIVNYKRKTNNLFENTEHVSTLFKKHLKTSNKIPTLNSIVNSTTALQHSAEPAKSYQYAPTHIVYRSTSEEKILPQSKVEAPAVMPATPQIDLQRLSQDVMRQIDKRSRIERQRQGLL
ncbi:MAG: hypothetical protein V3T17_02285 [Pseudomonadales bacterium]